MLKRVLCTIITLLMLVQIAITVGAVGYGVEYQNQPEATYKESFKDVKKDYWAFDYISEMANRGVINGYPNGYFYPNNPVTRAEFAKVMCLAGGVEVSSVSTVSYKDLKVTDWYTPYIEAGKYYLNGYVSNGEKYYKPNDNALREDIAVALVKLKGYDTSVYDESILRAMFTDYQSISSGARKYVAVAVENGLISGYEDDTFRGQNMITRAEASTLLWRAYQYGNGNKVFEPEELEIPEKPNTPSTGNKNNQEIVNRDDELIKTEEPKMATEEPQAPTEEPKPEYMYEVITVANNVTKPKNMTAANDGVYYLTDKAIYFADHHGDVEEVLNEDDIEYFGEEELTKAQKAEVSHSIGGLGINYGNNHVYTMVRGREGYFLYDVTSDKAVYQIDDITKYDHSEGYTLFDNTDYDHTLYFDDTINSGRFIIDNSKRIYDFNKMEFVEHKEIDYYIKNALELPFGSNSKYFYFMTKEGNFYKVDLDGNETLLFGIDDIEKVDRKPFKTYSFNKNFIEDFDLSGMRAVSDNEEIYFYDSNYQCIRMIRQK